MKLIQKQHSGFSEISQPNPIRWAIISKVEDGVFQTECAWLKCKDFFNDYVFTRNTGKSFTIYSFSASWPIDKQQPLYLAIKNLEPHWADNFCVINEYLDKEGFPYIGLQDLDDMYLLSVPDFYLKNTYYISLLSLIVRLCNYEVEFKNWQELVDYKDFPEQEQELWDTVVKKGWFFNLPNEGEDFLWYYDEKNNSKKIPGVNSILIHDCGVVAWSGKYA
jgi:hypothetical protein